MAKTWIDTDNDLEWFYDCDLRATWDESVENTPEGYRMAMVEELSRYLDHTKLNPAVKDGCPFGFNNTWTSDVYGTGTAYVYWAVNFVTGVVRAYDKSGRRDTLYVKDL